MNQHMFWCQVAICGLFLWYADEGYRTDFGLDDGDELVYWRAGDGRPA